MNILLFSLIFLSSITAYSMQLDDIPDVLNTAPAENRKRDHSVIEIASDDLLTLEELAPLECNEFDDYNHAETKRRCLETLSNAVAANDRKLCTLALAQGASANQGLAYAIRDSSKALCIFFIKRGADVNAPREHNQTFLHDACKGKSQKRTAIALYLIHQGANVDAPFKAAYCSLYTPLMFAAQSGNEQVVRALLAKGANVNAVSATGRTALFLAAQKQHIQVCQLLLENGARVNDAITSGPGTGKTALSCASEKGNINLCTLLLRYGASIYVKPAHTRTPLTSAAGTGSIMLVRRLLVYAPLYQFNFAEDARGRVKAFLVCLQRVCKSMPKDVIPFLIPKDDLHALLAHQIIMGKPLSAHMANLAQSLWQRPSAELCKLMLDARSTMTQNTPLGENLRQMLTPENFSQTIGSEYQDIITIKRSRPRKKSKTGGASTY